MIVSTTAADSRILAESSTPAPKLVDLLSVNSALTIAELTHIQSNVAATSNLTLLYNTSHALLQQLTTSYATLNIGIISTPVLGILPYSKILVAVEPFIPTQDYAEYGYFYEDYVAY